MKWRRRVYSYWFAKDTYSYERLHVQQRKKAPSFATAWGARQRPARVGQPILAPTHPILFNPAHTVHLVLVPGITYPYRIFFTSYSRHVFSPKRPVVSRGMGRGKNSSHVAGKSATHTRKRQQAKSPLTSHQLCMYHKKTSHYCGTPLYIVTIILIALVALLVSQVLLYIVIVL